MSTQPMGTPDATGREHIQALGAVITVCEDEVSTDGTYTLLDMLAPAGFENGWHTHEPAELFYVVDGTADVYLDGGVRHLGPGETCYVPGGARHGFCVTGEDPARVVATLSPAGFESFLRDVGTEVDERVIPAPHEVTEADLEALFATGEKHGIEFYGPLARTE